MELPTFKEAKPLGASRTFLDPTSDITAIGERELGVIESQYGASQSEQPL